MDKVLELKIAARSCHLLWAQVGISWPGGPRALRRGAGKWAPLDFLRVLVRRRYAGDERESEAFIWRDWTRRLKVRVSELFLPCKMGVPLDARAKQLIAI